ncbi:hypothetical protein OJAV_G00070240 [Oryzias javanicus]|uniref:Uncharacterized protein n=1 Tax=Oryzias javanicus TaxID=123683 RepID=A0A3S2PB61_ORYJA|nr:hypothetical protein OJAV_G00070240 [Oryzias javanicus]
MKIEIPLQDQQSCPLTSTSPSLLQELLPKKIPSQSKGDDGDAWNLIPTFKAKTTTSGELTSAAPSTSERNGSKGGKTNCRADYREGLWGVQTLELVIGPEKA